MAIAKYTNSNGKVAVLISPGFGAGWSTWASDEIRDFMLFDKKLVEMALGDDPGSVGSEDLEKYILEQTGEEYVYVGGWPCSVEWLTPGTPFRVEEYDGHETLHTSEDFVATA